MFNQSQLYVARHSFSIFVCCVSC